jgi:hypothetical protein
MKELIFKILAWWAFGHMLCLALAYGNELYPYTLPNLLREILTAYLGLFPWLLVKFWFPAVIWLLLFLLSGRARVLPWK